MSSHQFSVSIAEIRVVSGPTLLECQGVGSCIVVVGHDAGACVSGMAHIVLPKRMPNSSEERPGAFVDVAIEQLATELTNAGAVRERIKWAYAGGADFAPTRGVNPLPILEVGRRNTEATASELERLEAEVMGTDTGGTIGRDVSFCTSGAEVKIRTVHEGEKTLCNLQ